MKQIRLLLATTVALWLLTGCCWTDHSETIKEVAQPMFKELKYFYAKNKRFPDIQERNKMLEKVGCKVNGDICRYDGKEMIVNMWEKSYNYRIRIDLENTGCLFGIQDDGQNDEVTCENSACIKLGQ